MDRETVEEIKRHFGAVAEDIKGDVRAVGAAIEGVKGDLRAVGVVIEDVKSDVQAGAEGLGLLRSETGREFEETRGLIRLDRVEARLAS